MEFSLVEIEYYMPIPVKSFILVFWIFLLCLPYLVVSHDVLLFRIKKHVANFRKKWLARIHDVETVQHFAQQEKRISQPLIKEFYRSLVKLINASAESRDLAVKAYELEIDYYLTKRELHLKILAVVLVFSMAGLSLVGVKIILFDEPQQWFSVMSEPRLAQLFTNLQWDFHNWIFYPLLIALAETFLVFWLIVAKKKMALRLHREWTALVDAMVEGKAAAKPAR